MSAAAHIELMIFDVDGVLTDGGILLASDGTELKRFNAQDGAGVRYLQRFGVRAALLTGRTSEAVAQRAGELDITLVEQGATRKLPALERLLDAAGVAPERAGYMGDDLMDIPVMMAVGWSAAPASARPEVRQRVDFVTTMGGGHGAVREVAEHVLRAQDKWTQVVEHYVEAGREWIAKTQQSTE